MPIPRFSWLCCPRVAPRPSFHDPTSALATPRVLRVSSPLFKRYYAEAKTAFVLLGGSVSLAIRYLGLSCGFTSAADTTAAANMDVGEPVSPVLVVFPRKREALSSGFTTRCLRFVPASRLTTQDSLAVAGQAFRAGVITCWV